MKGKHLASSKSHVVKEDEGKAVDQLKGKIMPGDFIWVKLSGSSWWPAQVVNEDAVSQSNKPGDRSENEVLVRVYGSYNYLYVDPVKGRSEFENILEQNNGNYKEIFHEALNRDIACTRSGRSRQQGSKSKESAEEAQSKAFKGNGVLKKLEQKNLTAKGEAESKASMQNGALKKPKPTGLSSEVETKCNTSCQSGVQKKHNPMSSNTDAKKEANTHTVNDAGLQKKSSRQSARNKAKVKTTEPDVPPKKLELMEMQVQSYTPMQDGVLRKHRPSSPRREEASESRSLKQDGAEKKLKLNSPCTEKEAKMITPKLNDKKKLNSNTSYLATSSARKTCEEPFLKKSHIFNARRMRVMQSLGLTAPSGSPFDKNGNI